MYREEQQKRLSVFVSLVVLYVHAEIESVYFPLAFLRNNVLFPVHSFDTDHMSYYNGNHLFCIHIVTWNC